MAFESWDEMSVCEDCVYYIEMGTLPDDRTPAERDAHHLSMLGNIPRGWTLVTFSDTPEPCIYLHDDDDPEPFNPSSECYNDRCNGAYESGDWEADHSFSNSACDLCGAGPGDRHYGTLLLDKGDS